MKRKQQGIALILVMMVVVFCAMMLAAFLGSQRSALALFQSGTARDLADDAALSVYHFARSRVEKERAWGTPAAETTRQMLGSDISWTVHQRASGSDAEGRITGQLPNGLVFALEVLNNFEGTARVENVPPKSSRFEITVYRNPSGLSHEDLLENADRFQPAASSTALVRKAGLFDSGITASRGIGLYANRLDFLSKDPIRNQIRSNHHIVVPRAERLGFGYLTESGDSTPSRGYTGTVWAKADIVSGTDSLSNESHLANAKAQTGANFVPNAETNMAIPQLQPDAFEIPGESRPWSSTVLMMSDHWVSFNGGSEKRKIPILARASFVPDGPDPGEAKDVRMDEFYFSDLSLGGAYDDVKLLANNSEFGPPCEGIPSQGQDAAAGAIQVLDSDGSPYAGIQADLTTRTLNIRDNLTLDAEEDVLIASANEVDASGTITFGTNPVTVNLGATPTGEAGKSAIRSRGNITIEGIVKGHGSLISTEKSVALLPSAVDLESDEISDVAIYAKENVYIGNTDDTAYPGDVKFRGLVYAEGSFGFQANANLEVEGALVARTGGVHVIAGTSSRDIDENGLPAGIVGSKNLKVVYNPKYLDSYLKNSVRERAKVELMAWRPGVLTR